MDGVRSGQVIIGQGHLVCFFVFPSSVEEKKRKEKKLSLKALSVCVWFDPIPYIDKDNINIRLMQVPYHN